MESLIRNEPTSWVLFVGLVLVITSGCSLWYQSRGEPVSGPSVADVLAGVKAELRLAQQHSDLRALPMLAKVEIELEMVFSDKGEGSLSAAVVPLSILGRGSRAFSESTTQKVKIVLQPPPLAFTQESANLGDHPLARAIVEVAEDLALSAAKPPVLDVMSVEFNVKFVVVSSQTVEGGFDLEVLSVTKKATSSTQVSHNVKLVFAAPEEKPASWEDG